MDNDLNLLVTAARPGVLARHANVVDVLVRVQAPDTPATGLPERPGLNLAVVIDRSGSMSGKPIREAKRCAKFMVESLNAKDRASVIAYDGVVDVLVPSQPVNDKRGFLSAIAPLEVRGSTNLHGGWLKGADEVAAHLKAGTVSRVLLLSDGNANEGLRDIPEIGVSEVKWLSPKHRLVIALRSPVSNRGSWTVHVPSGEKSPSSSYCLSLEDSLQSNSAARFEEMRRISKI